VGKKADMLDSNLKLEIYNKLTEHEGVTVDGSNCTFRKLYEEDRVVYSIFVESRLAFYVLKLRGENVTKSEDQNPNAAREEYGKLDKAYNIVREMHSGLHMSAPVALFEKEKAILLGGCKGKNFNSYYMNHILIWHFFRKEMLQRYYLCGIWLSNYHKGSLGISSDKKYTDNRIDQLTRMSERLSQMNSPWIQKLDIPELKEHIESVLSGRSEIPIALLHGNYAYRNILIEGNQISLIDFEDSREDCLYYDMAMFISETLFKGMYFVLRPGIDREQVKYFTEAYETNINVDRDLLDAYVAYHMLAFLYQYLGRGQASRFHPKNILVNLRIRFLISWLNGWKPGNAAVE